MTGAREFRLTLHLHYFYKDHRALSKIFVTDEMKTVRNIKKKIKDIFGVKRFRLMSQNYYLPDDEDVRVLQMDDVVVAVPKSMLPQQEVDPMPPPQPPTQTVPVARETPKKKSKRSLEDSIVAEPTSKVKKTKTTMLSTESPFVPPAKSSPKDSAVEMHEASDDTPRLHSDTSSCKRIVQKINYFETLDKGNESVREELVAVLRSRSATPKSQKVFKPVTKLENVVNVVRNIVVSAQTSNCDDKEEETNYVTKRRHRTRRRKKKTSIDVTPEIVEVPYKPPNVEAKNNSHIRFQDESLDPIVVKSATPKSLENERMSDARKIAEAKMCPPSENEIETVEELLHLERVTMKAVQKEKDKVLFSKMVDGNLSSQRVADKPAAMQERVEEILSTERVAKQGETERVLYVNLSSQRVENKPLVWVSLDERVNKTLSTERVVKKGEKETVLSCVKVEDTMLTQRASPAVKERILSVEKVEERYSVLDNIIKATKERSAVGSEILTSPISEKLIASCPRMELFKPRRDDIVIFKILKMGTGYSPQISEAITGKVISYSADTDEVEFAILDGQNEFSEPEGKFSMETEDDESQLKCGTHQFLEWKTLIEPRLLYP